MDIKNIHQYFIRTTDVQKILFWTANGMRKVYEAKMVEADEADYQPVSYAIDLDSSVFTSIQILFDSKLHVLTI
jgi:hypothetical protein